MDEAGHTILCVGDLEGMSDLLQTRGYHVLTAASGDQALKALQAQPVDLIVSETHLPGIDWLRFLEFSHQMFPKTAQMVISADASDAVKAINQGGIQKFLLKPFEQVAFLSAVAEVMTLTQLKQEGLST